MRFSLLSLTCLACVGVSLVACSPPQAPPKPLDPAPTARAPVSEVPTSPQAQDAVSLDLDAIKGRIETSLAKVVGGQPSVSYLSESPIAGVYEFVMNGTVYYASPDGRFLIMGDMMDAQIGKSASQATRDKMRAAAFKDVNPEEGILFAGDTTEYTVTVFTDVDCGWCRRLHQEREQYHALGIAFRYFPWVRSGLQESPQNTTLANTQAAWCSTNQQDALTQAKDGKTVTADVTQACKDIVAKYYKIGQEGGVTGTPAMFGPNGGQVGGYVPPDALLERLKGGA